jgi:hypothetical protein
VQHRASVSAGQGEGESSQAILIPASGWGTSLEHMKRFELIPERTADGSVVLRAIVHGPFERLRRLLQRLTRS